jgi:hypothetical protein
VETRELEAVPSLRRLYPKAALGPLVPGGGGEELPDHALAVRSVEVDADRLTDYCRVCEFPLRDSLPATYPHILGFPLQMSLMTERSFPFPLLGMVHVGNRIEQVRGVPREARPDLRVWTEALRPHRRGRQFDVVTEVSLDGEVAWREHSTYLRRGGGAGDSAGGSSEVDAAAERDAGDESRGEDLPTAAIWRVPGDIGRRYAAVSGDRNPIHLHPLSAKAFGFPGAIAHGMWTLARSLAGFEGRIGDSFVALESADGERRHLQGTIG